MSPIEGNIFYYVIVFIILLILFSNRFGAILLIIQSFFLFCLLYFKTDLEQSFYCQAIFNNLRILTLISLHIFYKQ
jgi:hypothetical protein